MNQHNGSTTTKVSPSSPMNRTTKVWFTFHYRNPSRRKSGAFQQRSGAQPTTGLGDSRTATSDHTRVSTTTRASRVQRPKSNKFTSFQLPRILVESTPMHQMQKARAQVLKSFTLKFQQSNKCLWGNKRGRTKRRCTKNSKIKIY